MCSPGRGRVGRRFAIGAKPDAGASCRWFRVTGKLARLYGCIRRIAGGFGPDTPAARQLVYAPHLALLMDLYFKHSVRLCDARNNEVDDGTGRIGAQVYNDFVAVFRQALMVRNLLRRELHNWGWSSEQNAANLHAYLDGLFAKPGSLTVVHLRLFHTRERSAVSLVPVEDQMRELNAALRKVLDDKRTEAEQFGAVQRDHADQVGEYWVERATGGRGHYLRGDATPLLYGPDWVHGEVSVDDVGKREKLKETRGYLTMRRSLVRLQGEPPGEYFGMRKREARRTRTNPWCFKGRSATTGPDGRRSPVQVSTTSFSPGAFQKSGRRRGRTTLHGVRRAKAALSQWVQAPSGTRSGRKQPIRPQICRKTVGTFFCLLCSRLLQVADIRMDSQVKALTSQPRWILRRD